MHPLVDPALAEKVKMLNKQYEHFYDQLLVLWKKSMVFCDAWWVLLLITIIPWLIWIWIRRKESSGRLLCAAMFIIIVSCYMDLLGVAYGHWLYPVKLVPTFPPFAPWDFTLFPVAVMVFIQFYPNLSPYIKGVVFSFISAFIVEPFFIWLNLYDQGKWKHIYSFAIYFPLYLAASYIVTRLQYEKIE